MGTGAVCGCGVRPLQNQCAHMCVCGSESGSAVCVRATRKRVATHPLVFNNHIEVKMFLKLHFDSNETVCFHQGRLYLVFIHCNTKQCTTETVQRNPVMKGGFYYMEKQ